MSEEAEEENPYCEGSCDVCRKQFCFPYSTQKAVFCDWEGVDGQGCGMWLNPRELDLGHVAARNAALTFFGLCRFRRSEHAFLSKVGKDCAGIVARFVWQSRNDASWSRLQTQKPRFVLQESVVAACGKCGKSMSVWRNVKRWPFGRVQCSSCGTIIRSSRDSDLRNPEFQFIQFHANFDPEEHIVEVFDFSLPDGWE
jgi:hypothetical protein